MDDARRGRPDFEWAEKCGRAGPVCNFRLDLLPLARERRYDAEAPLILSRGELWVPGA